MQGLDRFLFFLFTDLYLDYFTTPCFVFVRDTLSYITILVLHFVFCQSPPTIVFSSLEWVIFILFLGRILIEVDQFMGAKTTDRKAAKQRLHQGSSYVNVVFSPHDESRAVMKKSEENVVIKNFSNYFRYILLSTPAALFPAGDNGQILQYF